MNTNGFTFEILINDALSNIDCKNLVVPNKNKNLLSIINDFEDGKWRHSKFDSFIWDNIAQTALSAKERNCLVANSYSELVASAKNLRLIDSEKDEIGKGSELAEIILYGIMKDYYNALPVVPKIFYKQNSQDNAKGADSVHIVIEENDFSIWFGEAKFYKSIEDARLSSILDSIGNSLKTDKLKKENSIIRNVNDIDTLDIKKNLKAKIKDSLKNTKSIDYLKPKIHIPIFILHECEATNSCLEISEEYKTNIINFHKERAVSFFKKQIKKLATIVFKYEDIRFHLILFPIPNKNHIVNRFLEKVEFFKKS
ncbi:MAG: HamA C-terminal domain-containing protein [Desulfitobacteriaceae bacterium]